LRTTGNLCCGDAPNSRWRSPDQRALQSPRRPGGAAAGRLDRSGLPTRRLTLDSTALVGVAGILASLGGVALGAAMSRQTARDLARDQREWAEKQAVRERQDEEAGKFDERLIEAMSLCPTLQGPAGETGEKIAESRRQLLRAWS